MLGKLKIAFLNLIGKIFFQVPSVLDLHLNIAEINLHTSEMLDYQIPITYKLNTAFFTVFTPTENFVGANLHEKHSLSINNIPQPCKAVLVPCSVEHTLSSQHYHCLLALAEALVVCF